MKKIILSVLIVVMFATPCFAQEIETDGLFSLHGTQWEITPIGNTNPEYYILSFYRGQIYFCNHDDECIIGVSRWRPHFYIDFMGISYFQSGHRAPETFHNSFCPSIQLYQGLASNLLETGIMYYKGQFYRSPPFPGDNCSEHSYVATLTKINDNWTPPSE